MGDLVGSRPSLREFVTMSTRAIVVYKAESQFYICKQDRYRCG